jgi:type II secretory pathway pseudopilin PulG
MEMTILLFGILLGALGVVWLRARRAREALDARIADLESRVDQLEGSSGTTDWNRWSFLPTGDEPESIAEATQRAKRLTEDDLAVARERLRQQRETDPER